MAATFKEVWVDHPTLTTVFAGTATTDADIKNLATTQGALSAAITVVAPYMQIWALLDFITAPVADALVNFWILNQDGTRYEYGSIASRVPTKPRRPANWGLPCPAVNTADHWHCSPRVLSPPNAFKIFMTNDTAQGLENEDSKSIVTIKWSWLGFEPIT